MHRKPKGIRRKGSGWQAFVRVSGTLYTKHFPADTPIGAMSAWREHTIGERAIVLSGQRGDIPRLPRSADGWCYVYVIRSGNSVKIGRSLDPSARLKDLQTTHARPLELIAAVPSHAMLEGAIHRRFARLRTREDGEWFHLEQDLIDFIQAMQAGANPVALLFD